MSMMRTQKKKIKTPTDYVVQHCLDLEQDYVNLYYEKKTLEGQLKTLHEFQDNVLKIAEKYLEIKKSSVDGDTYVYMHCLWATNEPEMFNFIRNNLKTEMKCEDEQVH